MDALHLQDLLAGANGFFLHFIAAAGLTAVFALIYLRLTPYPEFQLIREGKTAPAIAFGSALLGFVIALSGAIANSVSFADMLAWAGVALLVQTLVFAGLKSAFADLCVHIANDQIGPAILLGSLSLAAGMLTAACMTY